MPKKVPQANNYCGRRDKHFLEKNKGRDWHLTRTSDRHLRKVLLYKCFHVHLQLALCFYKGTNNVYYLVAKFWGEVVHDKFQFEYTGLPQYFILLCWTPSEPGKEKNEPHIALLKWKVDKNVF